MSVNIIKLTEVLTLICEIVLFVGAAISLTVGAVCLYNKGLSIDLVKDWRCPNRSSV